ncbi:MAG: allophanate hydrolase subunit 1 [Geminicoccaceae bacterium]
MISELGLSGMLVSFADRLDEAANRAAIAFRARVEDERIPGIEESATSLASVFLRFDPMSMDHHRLRASLEALLAERDWLAAPLPQGRRLWRIPVCFEGAHGPQLAQAAELAGLEPDQAIAELTAARTRVLTIGFAPGQPYLGILPPHWNIPRQTELTRSVPQGALTVAVRQFVLFAVTSPTGWRQVGRTAFRCFRADADPPFRLRPGDEVRFEAIGAAAFERILAHDCDGTGGAVAEAIE